MFESLKEKFKWSKWSSTEPVPVRANDPGYTPRDGDLFRDISTGRAFTYECSKMLAAGGYATEHFAVLVELVSVWRDKTAEEIAAHRKRYGCSEDGTIVDDDGEEIEMRIYDHHDRKIPESMPDLSALLLIGTFCPESEAV